MAGVIHVSFNSGHVLIYFKIYLGLLLSEIMRDFLKETPSGNLQNWL